MMRNPARYRLRKTTLASPLVLVLLAGTAAGATLPEPIAAQEPATEATPEVAPAGGLTVFFDPVTGEVRDRPSPEQREAMRQWQTLRAVPAPPPSEETRVETRVGDWIVVALDASFLTSLEVEVAPDGDVRYGCFQGPDHEDHEHAPAVDEPLPER
jgi:hypothetical protein